MGEQTRSCFLAVAFAATVASCCAPESLTDENKTESVGTAFVTRTIHAASHWNDTGLQVEPNTDYRVVAQGVWHDAWIASGPEGYPSPNCLMHSVESWRRVPDAPWFALICSVDRKEELAQQVFTRPFPEESPPLRFSVGGQLTCFANDAFRFYWNNWGEIRIAVRRADGGR